MEYGKRRLRPTWPRVISILQIQPENPNSCHDSLVKGQKNRKKWSWTDLPDIPKISQSMAKTLKVLLEPLDEEWIYVYLDFHSTQIAIVVDGLISVSASFHVCLLELLTIGRKLEGEVGQNYLLVAPSRVCKMRPESTRPKLCCKRWKVTKWCFCRKSNSIVSPRTFAQLELENTKHIGESQLQCIFLLHRISDFVVMPKVDSSNAMTQIHLRSLLTVVPNLALSSSPSRTKPLREAPAKPTKHKHNAKSLPSCQVQTISVS